MRTTRGAGVVVGALLIFVGAGCSETTQPADLSSSATASATSESSATASPTEPAESQEDAVIAAYKGWFETVNGMGLATDEEVASALSPYATETMVQHAVKVFAEEREKRIVPGGTVVFGPIDVTIDDGAAVVLECRDSSSETSVNADTGVVVGTGGPNTRYEAQMTRTEGAWLITDYSAVPDEC